MMRYIGKIFFLNSFQMVKVDRFVEKIVEQKKTTIFHHILRGHLSS